VTYLYYTAWAGLRAVAGRAPIIFHPTAHDEPPLALNLFDTMFRLPTAFCFLVEEERDLVRRRFHITQPSAVVGIATDLDIVGDPVLFRQESGLGDRPYLLYLGRVDPAKGSQELYEQFVVYKQRNPGPLALAIVGDPITRVVDHPDVVMAGFVDDKMKASALAGTTALVHPSYFESFSIVLTEAWAQRRPALVQGRCAVLAGQARRSGGAIPYAGYAQFEAAVDLLLRDQTLRDRMGSAGRRYVEERYALDTVIDRYERLLHVTV
jgi:glycosyltransferase involved in cell wall biosynthesis